MAIFELKLPKMGESVAEATITNWLINVGENVAIDQAVLEIATDKVDSEVPSEVAGILMQQLFQKDDLVQVGQTIALIETAEKTETNPIASTETTITSAIEIEKTIEKAIAQTQTTQAEPFLSPLIKNIAKQENISIAELNTISGSGKENRITKEDVLKYLQTRQQPTIQPTIPAPTSPKITPQAQPQNPPSTNSGDEIIEMDRMRKLISGYMTASLQTSAHVQSFIEVDVTNIVKWREKVKTNFEKREGEKLTYTPIFIEAVAKAIKDFPGINISVDGEYIIKKKNINIGMAAALPNGNLIVPVIKNADQLNLVGMTKAVNDLGSRAKSGKLKPDDTQGGTYTVTNVGTFGSIFGTPIINQPQVGILALGAIRKVPAVIETPEGDFIGIRQKMFLSHSYDHRVVDGALGGSFVKRVAEYLEAFDINRDI